MKGRRAALLFVVPAALLFLMIRASAKTSDLTDTAAAAPESGDSRHSSASAEKWVDSTLRKMSVDEKIGQLLFTTYHGSLTPTDAAAYATMKDLLTLPEPPDGVFGFNDQYAVNAMKATLDAGLRIPEDVAFIGSGNIQHADFLRVPLTTVDQNSISIGERAAKIALAMMESKSPIPAKTVLLEPRLVVRTSSIRAAGEVSSPTGPEARR